MIFVSKNGWIPSLIWGILVPCGVLALCAYGAIASTLVLPVTAAYLIAIIIFRAIFIESAKGADNKVLADLVETVDYELVLWPIVTCPMLVLSLVFFNWPWVGILMIAFLLCIGILRDAITSIAIKEYGRDIPLGFQLSVWPLITMEILAIAIIISIH